MALGAIAAILRFYSAYPMPTSTAVMEYLASRSGRAGLAVADVQRHGPAIRLCQEEAK